MDSDSDYHPNSDEESTTSSASDLMTTKEISALVGNIKPSRRKKQQAILPTLNADQEIVNDCDIAVPESEILVYGANTEIVLVVSDGVTYPDPDDLQACNTPENDDTPVMDNNFETLNHMDDSTTVHHNHLHVTEDDSLDLQNDIAPENPNLNNFGPKKGRSSIANPTSWKRAVNKNAREKGKAYLGFRRVNPASSTQIKQDSRKPAREMGPSCTSKACESRKTRLCNTVAEEERRQLFESFWSMTWQAKKTFVCSSVTEVKPLQAFSHPKSGRRRVSTFFYHLRVNGEKIPVCQTMYLSTLGLKRSEVRYWLECFRQANKPDLQSNDGNRLGEMNETEHAASSSTSRTTSKTLKEKALADFFDNLPTMPSHYCRKESNKTYLQADVKSWAQLYGWYQTMCADKNVDCFSRNTFSREVKRRKLGIFKPKKDRCDTCLAFEKKNINRVDYENHIKRKEAARFEKEKDKELAKAGAFHLLCFDLMNVQSVPKTRSSCAYYKLKLMLHNFTIYNLVTHDAQCFWFDETEANLSASVFASCIIDYITELIEQEKKPIIMYSDGCNYQNRNSVLSNALLHFSTAYGVSVTQKYLEKGHTYMEGDSVHATIERYIDEKDLDLPSQFVRASTEARQRPMPYRAKYLDHAFFKNYNENVKYDSIRPGANRPSEPKVTDLRALEYQTNGTIRFKINFEDEFKILPVRPKPTDPLHGMNFSPLFSSRFKITKDKFSDLQSMKPALLRDAWYFYDNIPHDDASIRSQKRRDKAGNTEKAQAEETKPKQFKKTETPPNQQRKPRKNSSKE